MRTDAEIKNYCTIVRQGTKQNGYFRWAFTRNYGTSLSDCYKSYSTDKARAMEHCKNICEAEGGEEFHITGKNVWHFSVSWKLPSGAIRVETSCNSYYVE